LWSGSRRSRFYSHAAMTPPLLIAHRGASGEAPENTIAAFDLALEQGADVIELDVRIRGDGELITLHDPTLERTTGDPRPHDAVFGPVDHPAAPARLEDVFLRYGSRPRYLVDLKDPLPSWETRVVELIERHGLRSRTVVQSFDLDALERLHRVVPWLPLTALYRRATSLQLAVADIPAWAYAVGAFHPRVDAEFVAAVHARGIRVHPWTVDVPEEAARFVRLGVDAVITNVPGVVRDAVRRPLDVAA